MTIALTASIIGNIMKESKEIGITEAIVLTDAEFDNFISSCDEAKEPNQAPKDALALAESKEIN